MKRRATLWLTVILLVAAAVRLFNIGREGLWLDEFWSMEFSAGRSFEEDTIPTNVVVHDPVELTRLSGAGPWWKIWTNLQHETNPPIFYTVLRFWRVALGDGDVAVRFLPLLCSLASIVLLYSAVRDTHDQETALWACSMAALAAPMVVYATETRAYSMMVVLTLAATWAMVRIQRFGATWPRLIALAAFTLLGMLAHYYCLGTFVALGIYAMLVLRGRTLRRVLAAFGAGAVVYAVIWGPFFVEQVRGAAFSHQISHEPGQGLLSRTVLRALVAPLRQWIGVAIPAHFQLILAPVLAAVYVVGAIWIVRKRKDLWLWGLLVLCPTALIAAVDLKETRGHLDLPRYLIATGPPVAVLLAAAGIYLKPLLRRVIRSVAVVGCIVGLYFCSNLWHGEWQAASNFIASRADPKEDLIVFVVLTPRDITPGWMYMGIRHYLPGKIPPILLWTSGQGHQAILQDHPRHVFLVADMQNIDPRALLPEYVVEDWIKDERYVAVWRMRPVDHNPLNR